jgi:hypothetical protein
LTATTITVLGSQSNEEGVIVKSRINGVVPMGVDCKLNPTSNGYKVTDLFVAGINMDLAALRGGQSSSVTAGRCKPCWLPYAKRMRATVSSDNRPGCV